MIFLRLRYATAVIANNSSSLARKEYLNRREKLRTYREEAVISPLRGLSWRAIGSPLTHLLEKQLHWVARVLGKFFEIPIQKLTMVLEDTFKTLSNIVGVFLVIVIVAVVLKILDFIWHSIF